MPKGKEEIKEREKEKIDEPMMYKVVMYNDDFTPADFVVHVLKTVFGLPMQSAFMTMSYIHNNDHCTIGTYAKETAIEKTEKVMEMAKQFDFPLFVEATEDNE